MTAAWSTSRASIDASDRSPGATGGSVSILGEHVALTDAVVDASGDAGGGSVLVGGDFQGGNPDVQNAQRTFVAADAEIRADAVTRGDGGKVIVWADGDTRFDGSISARGGAQGGNGGFAEVSGKEQLTFTGQVDLTAPAGQRGTLLLDPKNITIDASADPIPGATVPFTDNAASNVTIGASKVVDQLNLSNVVLQANNDVTVDAAIDSTANPNPGDLTLQAGRSIALNQAVSIQGNFTATANDPGADAKQPHR